MDRDLALLVNNITNNWKTILDNELLVDVTKRLTEKAEELQGLPIYPSPANTFRAFSYRPIEEIRVVIIGQDCYHGPDQAIGLCFGVENGKAPPSLLNINRELQSDVGKSIQHLSLENWADQGVLLVNSALTVHQSLAGSHLKIWNKYTDYVIKQFALQTEQVVFLLWGNYAKSKASLISQDRNHLILTANHPSPLSANRGGWFGNGHFQKTNQFLQENGKQPINW